MGKADKADKARQKIDWDEIEFDYISSLASMRELASKYKVSLRQLGGYASDNDWTDKRKAYSNRIATNMLAEIEALNVREGFSAYKATFVMLRRAFDDYVQNPTAEKLRAMDGLLTKGLTLEGFETERKGIVSKSWKDVADPRDVGSIQDFATQKADEYFDALGSESDADGGVGWTD